MIKTSACNLKNLFAESIPTNELDFWKTSRISPYVMNQSLSGKMNLKTLRLNESERQSFWTLTRTKNESRLMKSQKRTGKVEK